MATKHLLSAETRDTFGKNEMNRIRMAGRVPGVVYGPDQKPIHITVDNRELTNILQHVTIENTIIDLKITGKVKKTFQTLIRELQTHPYRRQIEHLDFFAVPKGRTVTVDVPIILHGTPQGVRLQGGVVQHILRDLEIEVLPDSIPEHITLDITELTVGQSIHVSDLPKGDYAILTDPERPIVSVVIPAAAKSALDGAVGEETASSVAEPELIRREAASEEEK
ncbi:50S ribosomal protein L25 [bacterium]|nr:50S ribosomal protein L25 [bacterium]